MRLVLRELVRYAAKTAMAAVMITAISRSATAAPPTIDLPPCGAGRIVNDDASTLTLQNCSIVGLSTPGSGGAVENYGTLELINVFISGNTAGSGGGGGIYNA